MRPLLCGGLLLCLGSPAVAEEPVSEETEAAVGSEENEEEVVVVYTLSQWLEDNGGREAVDAMLAEEAREEVRRTMEENPEEAVKLQSAAESALETCKDTRFGALDPMGLEGSEITDADFSIVFSVPMDGFFDLKWDEGKVAVGSHGYGVTANTSLLWEDSSAVVDCLEGQLDDAIDRIIEERDALLAGDLSTLRGALAAVAVQLAIDEAYKYDHDLGELLDTLQKICSTSSGACF